MPELQEEDGALGFDCLDHWLPSINLLLSVDPGCVGIPGRHTQGIRSYCREEGHHEGRTQMLSNSMRGMLGHRRLVVILSFLESH